MKQNPALLDYRGRQGENYLHVCCGIDITKHHLQAADSIKSVDVLIDRGLPINGEAFREGEWKATPLWYAVARGKNLKLARHLLKRGATPEYCLWAAAYNDDAAAVHLLVHEGASIDAVHGDGDTPLVFAVRWSRFGAARELLKCGADPNYQDKLGNTALHYMLKKRSDPSCIRMLIDYGARLDLPNREGTTAHRLLSRSRDVRYRELA
ncbi:MAG: ankyrin repeat domain-containing protein [Candidatus Eremiobacteraeota bacterium]|nr:ankyrin repeat domain-containing protein [Candidatus Eremiobacteraeota bacterium]